MLENDLKLRVINLGKHGISVSKTLFAIFISMLLMQM